MTSIYFHMKASQEKEIILKMFFESWADEICNRKLKYSTITADNVVYPCQAQGSITNYLNEIIKVEIENKEDATLLKLKGIPEEFKNYLEFVDWKN